MTVSLGQIAALRAGYPFRSRLPSEPKGTVAVIQGRDVDSSRLRVMPSEGGFSRINARLLRSLPEHELDPGDVIVMARGPRNYAVPVDDQIPRPAIVPASFHVLCPDRSRVHPLFLAWLLNQDRAQTFLRANNSGTTVPMIALQTLRNLPILLPPLGVQEQVAELHRLIEHEHTLMNRLTEARRTQLRAWANQTAAHV